jgi:class 3 adenylate cyclase
VSLFRHLSIKSQLLILLLVTGLLGVTVVTWVGYRTGRDALEDAVFRRLTAIRTAKAQSVQDYFKGVRAHLATLASDERIAAGLRDFEKAVAAIDPALTTPVVEAELRDFYVTKFLPDLASKSLGRPEVDFYLPRTPQGRWLQHQYIAQNPHAPSERWKLQRGESAGAYAAVHERLNAQLTSIMQQMGYYDLFLINPDGRVVYSVAKEVDFATMLIGGPYADTSLATVFKQARQIKERDAVTIADFTRYAPSGNLPAAFIGAPVFSEGSFVGVIALQLSTDRINSVMTGDRGWVTQGRGKTGENFLFGDDLLYRSDARQLIEDLPAYLAKQRGTADEPMLNEMQRLQTSILTERLGDDLSKDALRGKTGIGIAPNQRGNTRLISYQPAGIEGLNWGLVSTVDYTEAFAPIAAYGKVVIVTAVIFVVLTTLIAVVFAGIFVRPIHALTHAAGELSTGRNDVRIDVKGRDELSTLATSFNVMVAKLHANHEAIQRKNAENESLLLNILPAPVAKRMRDGEEQITDLLPNVSVLFADILGVAENAGAHKGSPSLNLLNELIVAVDEAAERHGVEKVKTIGCTYMAACGMSVPRVDHAFRIVRFARDMQEIVERIGQAHGLRLALSIGINSGPVVAGVVGRHKFIYDLWGDTVNMAGRLQSIATAGAVKLSQTTRDLLGDSEACQSAGAIDYPGKPAQTVWVLPST